jgi:hypothetical protein
LANETGLNSAQYSVYVLGFSTASQMELQSNGQFAPFSSASGIIPSYNINTMPTITLDTATQLTGARLYFFVEPNNQLAPAFSYSNNGMNVVQPTNPPTSSSAPFDIVEITQPVGGLPSIDVQTMDGFSFPLTLTLNNNLGQTGANSTVTRAEILTAYSAFMNDQGSAGSPYQALAFGPNSIAGQNGGIVNPGQYLVNGANANSALNTVWNTDLTTLFETPGRTISMIGDDGNYYQGTPEQLASGQWVLHFVGYTNATDTTPNGNVFNIYNPLTPDPLGQYQPSETAGEMVFANDGVFADTSTNVLVLQSSSVGTTPSQVALGLERDIVSALNRGVALLGPSGANAGMSGGASLYWGTETNWYPAGQTGNLFSLFMHTGTINGVPIFALPSGAVMDAQGTLMGSTYGFAYDQTPTHGPVGQPAVSSKFDPVPSGATAATITLGPWLPPSPSSPPPSNGGLPPMADILFLAEDIVEWMMESYVSEIGKDPQLLQTVDQTIMDLNAQLQLNNPALGTNLDGLQSAMLANPYLLTSWGVPAMAVGLDWFESLFGP